ncbi:MAG: hypothetical protein U9O94_05745 [Nanoarchaeota archaeon]|nr:hypothetical protein [Nanoarchaeota archaeon]
MGEGEAYLHDYGGVFTKEQKYIGDQSGLEKFATGVDVLSSAATLGSIAMIAGGVLAAPFTSGTSLALAGKGAVGLGAT